MKKLFLMLWRDIKQTKGQFVSILIVIAVGCFFFAGMLEGSTAIENQVSTYYKDTNFADGTGYFLYLNQQLVDEVKKDSSVDDAEGRLTVQTYAQIKSVKADLTVSTLTSRITTPDILEGKLPTAGDEIIIDSVFAGSYGLKVGDSLTFNYPQISRYSVVLDENNKYDFKQEISEKLVTYKICGTYHSPELIYKVNLQDTAASSTDFGFALTAKDALSPFTEDVILSVVMPDFPFPINYPLGEKLKEFEVEIYNEILFDGDDIDLAAILDKYKLKEGDSELIEMLQKILHGGIEDIDSTLSFTTPFGVCLYHIDMKNHPSEMAFRSTFNQIKNLVAVFPLIFFIVAAVITFISLSKTVDNQRTQIGIIQAIGVSKGNIYMVYLFYALFASLIGSIVGGILGVVTLPYIYKWVFSMQFSMPSTAITVSAYFTIAGIVISVAVALLAAFISSHRTMREIPAQALRPKPPKSTKKILIERISWLWKKISFGGKMILRNIFLHKTRILLSSLGVVGCLTLLVAGIGIKDRVSFITTHFQNGINYNFRITANELYSIDNTGDILALDTTDNLERLTIMPNINGKVIFNNKIEDMAIYALPTGSDDILFYSDYHSRDRINIESNTFAIPHLLAEKLGISVGDKISISSTNSSNESIMMEIVVTDIAMQYADQSIYTSYELFTANNIKIESNLLLAHVKDADSIDKTQAALEESDLIKSTYSAKAIQDILIKSVTILDAVVSIIVIGAGVLAITVIYNITSINVLERKREIATLMVLGYRKRETNRLIFIENMVITAIGCLIGLPLGFGLLTWLVGIVNSMNIALPGNLTFLVSLICIAMTFVFSIIATLMLNHKMQKISMVEALKSVE